MPWWKELILASYYYPTAPCRRWRIHHLAARGQAPIMVVMFHRIADDAANGWTTHSRAFRKGILWLKQNFEMVSLAEAQRRVASNENHRPSVTVTFDDGYETNYDWALPFLLEQQVPLTYFVSAGPVLERSYFEHDEKMGNHYQANTVAQLRELAENELFEVGAHTRNHPDLGQLHDADALFDEVVAARNDLEDAIGTPITRFAFPFGQHANLNQAVFEMARENGFECAVSAYGGYNFPGDDSFHLQRMGCDGPLIRLKNWTCLDPIKQWKIDRYDVPSAAADRELAGAVS